MRARLIVIGTVGSKDTPQMCLAENRHLVQALTTQRTNQTFGYAILPRGVIGRSRMPIALSRHVKTCP